MFAGNFPPVGWAFCDGQLMPISQNDAMFVLIGTTYGGDGESTFGLPNLQSRIPLHFGNGPDGVNYQLAEAAGTESVTLTTQQIPVHNHALIGSLTAANTGDPTNKLFGTSGQVAYLIEADPEVQLAATAATPVGGSQPHENCQPFLCINYIISLFGLFPQQT
ncbi:MAG TPA: tail fiber protein [Thermoanaerobaculia bacterium]|nr:tail fiber protein [Thermoanaerobaculia bacterium]